MEIREIKVIRTHSSSPWRRIQVTLNPVQSPLPSYIDLGTKRRRRRYEWGGVGRYNEYWERVCNGGNLERTAVAANLTQAQSCFYPIDVMTCIHARGLSSPPLPSAPFFLIYSRSGRLAYRERPLCLNERRLTLDTHRSFSFNFS